MGHYLTLLRSATRQTSGSGCPMPLHNAPALCKPPLVSGFYRLLPVNLAVFTRCRCPSREFKDSNKKPSESSLFNQLSEGFSLFNDIE